jgi:hypothetical protein
VTSPEPAASQREMDLLRADVGHLAKRVDDLDMHGSRGVLTLQAQVTDLVKDMGQLTGAFDAHQRQHVADARDRLIGRRWLVGTGLAGTATMAAVITLLLEILSHLH